MDIVVYDHSTGDGGPVGSLEQQFISFPNVIRVNNNSSAEELKLLKTCKICFCHPEDDKHWNLIVGNSDSNTVRIRTSSVGRMGKDHMISGKRVVVLELQKPHFSASTFPNEGVTSEEWNNIVKEIVKDDLALKIARGDVPLSLRRVFQVTRRDYIIALSLLCEARLLAGVAESKLINGVIINAPIKADDWFKPFEYSSGFKNAAEIIGDEVYDVKTEVKTFLKHIVQNNGWDATSQSLDEINTMNEILKATVVVE